MEVQGLPRRPGAIVSSDLPSFPKRSVPENIVELPAKARKRLRVKSRSQDGAVGLPIFPARSTSARSAHTHSFIFEETNGDLTCFNLNMLDMELCLSIAEFLDCDSVLSLAKTCRTWRVLCQDSWLWGRLIDRDFVRQGHVTPKAISALGDMKTTYFHCLRIRAARMSHITKLEVPSKQEAAISREGHGMTQSGEYVYIYGGFTDCRQVHVIAKADLANNTGVGWTVMATLGEVLPSWLYGVSMHTYEGKLLLFGGMESPGYSNAQNTVWLGTIHCGEDKRPVAVSWEKHVPGDTNPFSPVAPVAVGYPASCVVNKRLYVFGGISNEHCITNGFYSLDLASMVWSRIESSSSPEKLPPPRCSATMHCVDNKLYLFGGSDSHMLINGKDLGDVHAFDLERGGWSKVSCIGSPNPLNLGAGHSSALVGKNVVFFCGGNALSNAMSVLDMVTLEWKCPRLTGTSPVPRCSAAMVHVGGGKLVLMGGFNTQYGTLGDTIIAEMGTEVAEPMANAPTTGKAYRETLMGLFHQQLKSQAMYEMRQLYGNMDASRELLALADPVPTVALDDISCSDLSDESCCGGNSGTSSSVIEGEVLCDEDFCDSDEDADSTSIERVDYSTMKDEVEVVDPFDVDYEEDTSQSGFSSLVTDISDI